MLVSSITSFLMLLGMSPTVEVANKPSIGDQPQISLEVRMMSISQDFDYSDALKQIGIAERGDAFLTEKQLRSLMQNLQGDRGTNVILAPRLRTLSGQQATMQIGQSVGTGKTTGDNENGFIGTKIEVRATASPDRHFVLADLKATLTEPGLQLAELHSSGRKPKESSGIATIGFSAKTRIPKDRTLLISVGVIEVEERFEYCPPILSELPFANRLFRTVGYRKQYRRVLLLVTPRIVEEAAVADSAIVPAAYTEIGPRRLPSMFELQDALRGRNDVSLGSPGIKYNVDFHVIYPCVGVYGPRMNELIWNAPPHELSLVPLPPVLVLDAKKVADDAKKAESNSVPAISRPSKTVSEIGAEFLDRAIKAAIEFSDELFGTMTGRSKHGDPEERQMRMLSGDVEYYLRLAEEKRKLWNCKQPSELKYDRLEGAIGP